MPKVPLPKPDPKLIGYYYMGAKPGDREWDIEALVIAAGFFVGGVTLGWVL